MKDKYGYSTGQLFNFAQNSYLERTSRPIYAIVFLLPFIVLYEVGTILINTDVLNQSQVRVASFVWLQNFLEHLGFGSKLAWVAPPLAVVIILVALQLSSRKRWHFGLGDILPMAVECILLAVPLIVLSLVLNSSSQAQGDVGQFDNGAIRNLVLRKSAWGRLSAESIGLSEVEGTQYHNAAPSCSSVAGNGLSALSETSDSGGGGEGQSLLANIVTGIGAGIYEELVFRLILICVLMLVFQDVLGLSRRKSIILAVLVSAALFSAHHHIVFLNGRFGQTAAFNWPEFVFRTIAGVYFAVLFAIRGFGITAGTHAFYDIIATIVNAVFFQQ